MYNWGFDEVIIMDFVVLFDIIYESHCIIQLIFNFFFFLHF